MLQQFYTQPRRQLNLFQQLIMLFYGSFFTSDTFLTDFVFVVMYQVCLEIHPSAVQKSQSASLFGRCASQKPDLLTDFLTETDPLCSLLQQIILKRIIFHIPGGIFIAIDGIIVPFKNFIEGGG